MTATPGAVIGALDLVATSTKAIAFSPGTAVAIGTHLSWRAGESSGPRRRHPHRLGPIRCDRNWGS